MTKDTIRHLLHLAWVSSAYLFLYIPIAILVIFSFNTAPFPAPWHTGTLDWYRALFYESHLWQALGNSCIIALCATALSLGMGICFVYYGFSGGNLQRLFGIFYANIIIPEIVLAVGLLTIFTLFSIQLGMVTLIIAHTVLGLGYTVPLLYARYQELDPTLIEASLDLGATRQQTFSHIIMPLLQPALISASLIVFIISFDDFLLSYFCGSGETQTLSLYLLSMLRTEISPVINALSTLLLCGSSLLALIFCSLNVRSKTV